MQGQHSSLSRQENVGLISRRAYNMLTFGLVTVSFLVMFVMCGFASGSALSGSLVVTILSIVASIGGIVIMGIGKSKQNVGLSLVGYALFTLSFGWTLSLILRRYDVGTINYAFAITGCVSGIFLILGTLFPSFFARLGNVLFGALIAIMLVELVSVLFLHLNQTFIDYIVILLFCGYLGYDSYMMSSDDPTVPNAIWYACNIYTDIVNILIRVLDILDNR